MKKKLILLNHIQFFNLIFRMKIKQPKIGLLAPLSGEYKELGDSLLHSLN